MPRRNRNVADNRQPVSLDALTPREVRRLNRQARRKSGAA